MSEEDIQRQLVLDEERCDARHLNIIIKMISKWIENTNQTEEESQVTFDKIIVHLSLVETSRRHADQVKKVTEAQLQQYKILYEQMELKIYLKKQEISDQKKELEKAKIIKQNRVKYNLLTKAIAQNPPRIETVKNMKTLHQELARLAGQKKKLQNQMAERKKEFGVLSATTNALSVLLDYDGTSTETSTRSNSQASASRTQ